MALELNPDMAEVHNDLGIAYARVGNTSEAISHFETALALKPDYQLARDNLNHAQAREKMQ